jgi:proteasome lid subunit RPN8/RPN11
MLHLSADLLEEIGRRALAAYPEECCGILVGKPAQATGGAIIAEHALPAGNLADAEKRPTFYTIDPAAILHADRFATANGLEIIGFYHSHPDHPPRPSKTDIALAWEAYTYLIVSISHDAVLESKAWRFTPGGSEPAREEAIAIIDHVS